MSESDQKKSVPPNTTGVSSKLRANLGKFASALQMRLWPAVEDIFFVLIISLVLLAGVYFTYIYA